MTCVACERSTPSPSTDRSRRPVSSWATRSPSSRTTSRRWIGSENQVLHFLTDRYAPDDPRFAGPNHMEIRIRRGVITVNGFPVMGARKIG